MVQDADRLYETMSNLGFCKLVVAGAHGFEASPLPVLVDPNGSLLTHVAAANPLASITPGTPALAVFTGPNAYVSPALYPSKSKHGMVVPTWNYVAVHAHGALETFTDRQSLRSLVEALTDLHEAGRDSPWRVDDAPDAFIQSMLGKIVGLRLSISRLEGKWKMSQNRSLEDRRGVAVGMADDADPKIREVGRIISEMDV